MGLDATHWQARLDELATRHGMIGASLAIFADNTVATAATGVLNIDTGAAVTTDSVFQIGSITKSYTAVVIMQLVAEGKLKLDHSIGELLPELRFAESGVVERVTVRHLLTHTSGIEGDHFQDTGRGDDVLARYVDSCAELGLAHPVGATMSYCNTGYVILGRVIEKLTGTTWDEALRARLFEPLGLSRTVTLPEQLLRFPIAHGHMAKPGEPLKLAPISVLPRAMGPAGLICSTAEETLAFGRMCLAGGIAPNGTRIVDAESLGLMTAPQVTVPDPWVLAARYWGLGFLVSEWDGRRVYGHDGTTLGQNACLRMVPDAQVAMVVLTNGGNAYDLIAQLSREMYASLCDLEMPAPPRPPATAPKVDLTPLVGTYEGIALRLELRDTKGSLVCRVTEKGPLAEANPQPPRELTLLPVTDRLFLTRLDDHQETWTPLVFYQLDDGSPYLHMGARAMPKVSGDGQ